MNNNRERVSNINKAFELIKESFPPEDILNYGKKSPETIKFVEKKLGVSFPESYKHYLLMGSGGPEDLFPTGIITEDFEEILHTGIYYSVFFDRSSFNIPKNIINLMETGDGSFYALDLSQMNEENECPVVIWPLNGYEDTPDLEIVAPDFGTWFLNEVKKRVEWKNEENK